jgi:hypothetical protein
MQQRCAARLVAFCVLMLLSACGEGTILTPEREDGTLQGTSAASASSYATDGGQAAPGQAVGVGATGDAATTSVDQRATRAADAGTSAGSPAAAPAASWQGMRVGTNFWFLSSWAEDAWAANVNFASTTNPWSSTFLSDLAAAHYGVLRFMDWGGTNNSSIRNWSERTQQTAAGNQSGGDVGGRGIAYEWMFDLCNRMHADCWINVPHLGIESYEQNPADNYFTSLAKLAKEKLDPGLALYVEYSNETWNGGFQQAAYCQNRGMGLHLAGDAYGASFKFHVYASSRMYDAFQQVYGSEAARLRWVVAGQLSSDYGTQQQVAALNDASINPGQRMPHFYAISNYVGSDGAIDGAAGDAVDKFKSGIQQTLGWATQQKSTVAATGMTLVAYEGGQHITNHAAAFSRDPAAYDLYREWLDAMSSLYALTVHYGFSGTYNDTNAWGSKEHAGQPLAETPKARALRDWISAHP